MNINSLKHYLLNCSFQNNGYIIDEQNNNVLIEISPHGSSILLNKKLFKEDFYKSKIEMYEFNLTHFSSLFGDSDVNDNLINSIIYKKSNKRTSIDIQNITFNQLLESEHIMLLKQITEMIKCNLFINPNINNIYSDLMIEFFYGLVNKINTMNNSEKLSEILTILLSNKDKIKFSLEFKQNVLVFKIHNKLSNDILICTINANNLENKNFDLFNSLFCMDIIIYNKLLKRSIE